MLTQQQRQYVSKYYKRCQVCHADKNITSILHHKYNCSIAIQQLNQDRFLDIMEIEDNINDNQQNNDSISNAQVEQQIQPLSELDLNQVQRQQQQQQQYKRKQVKKPWEKNREKNIGDESDSCSEEQNIEYENKQVFIQQNNNNQQDIIQQDQSGSLQQIQRQAFNYKSASEMPDYRKEMLEYKNRSKSNTNKQKKSKSKIDRIGDNLIDKYLNNSQNNSSNNNQNQQDIEEEQKIDINQSQQQSNKSMNKDQETNDFEMAFKMQQEMIQAERQNSTNQFQSDEQMAQSLFQMEQIQNQQQAEQQLYQQQQQMIQNNNQRSQRRGRRQQSINDQQQNVFQTPQRVTRSQNIQIFGDQFQPANVELNNINIFGGRRNDNFMAVQPQQPMSRRSFMANMQVEQMNDDQIYQHFTNLDQQIHQKNNRLKSDFIKEINEIKYVKNSNQNSENKYEENSCQICFDDYEDGQKIKILPCLHKFHSQCLTKWLKINGTCPICKNKVGEMYRNNANSNE